MTERHARPGQTFCHGGLGIGSCPGRSPLQEEHRLQAERHQLALEVGHCLSPVSAGYFREFAEGVLQGYSAKYSEDRTPAGTGILCGTLGWDTLRGELGHGHSGNTSGQS